MDHLCPICSETDPKEFGIVRARPSGRSLYCRRCLRVKVKACRDRVRQIKNLKREATRQLAIAARTRNPESVCCQHDICYSKRAQGSGAAASEPIGAGSFALDTPDRLVLLAIQMGARTQREIIRQTRLEVDQLGEALATLLLETREIATEVVDDERRYFIRERESAPPACPLPASSPNFSVFALGGIAQPVSGRKAAA